MLALLLLLLLLLLLQLLLLLLVAELSCSSASTMLSLSVPEVDDLSYDPDAHEKASSLGAEDNTPNEQSRSAHVLQLGDNMGVIAFRDIGAERAAADPRQNPISAVT